MSGRPALVGALVGALIGPAACVSPPSDGEVFVSAAASLSDAFADIEAELEAQSPGLDVRLNLAGSSLLAEQVLSGAPVDVFASADAAHMDRLAASGLISGEPRVFAANSMRIATPPGNPAGVSGLEALSDESLYIGLCDESAPCGRLAREVLAAAAVTASVDTFEPNVRSLLTKIALGELDAGIVYVTDVLAADGEVTGVGIADDLNAHTAYPIATVASGPNPAGAGLFVDFVLSDRGRAILADHGFAAP